MFVDYGKESKSSNSSKSTAKSIPQEQVIVDSEDALNVALVNIQMWAPGAMKLQRGKKK